MKALAAALLSLVGACAADPPPPFTFYLTLERTLPAARISVDGSFAFKSEHWEFPALATARPTASRSTLIA